MSGIQGNTSGAAVSRQSQVNEQFDNLEYAAKRYEECVTRAEQRLQGILLKPPTGAIVAGPSNKPTEEPVLVDVAVRMRGIVGTLNACSTRFESLLDRTEL